MKYELRKTHYEQVVDFFRDREQGNTLAYLARMADGAGLDDMTFEEFAEIIVSIPKSMVPEMRAQVAFEANVFFHLFMMKRHGEKIYYVTPGLAARLAATEPALDAHFLKSPFREIFVQVDPGLFSIRDIDGSSHPVHGFYVNFEDRAGMKDLRIMAASVLHPTPGIPFNDSVFFFRVQFGEGRIDELVREYAVRPRKATELEAMSAGRNIDNMEEFAMFVANVLLYVTSPGARLDERTPEPLTGSPKSAAKKRKLQQRMARQPTYRVIVAGGSDVESEDVAGLRAAGSVANWKLTKRVRVRGYWRGQWFGSVKDGSRNQAQIWIEAYEKGPQFAETINKTLVVE